MQNLYVFLFIVFFICFLGMFLLLVFTDPSFVSSKGYTAFYSFVFAVIITSIAIIWSSQRTQILSPYKTPLRKFENSRNYSR